MENFKKACAVNVKQWCDKKSNLDYLKWAKAWELFVEHYPNGKYEVVKNEQGLPFFKSEEGYMVYTRATAGDVTHEMWLPVMDNRNKAMKQADMFAINKTVMRCLVKNLAMFGIGLHVFQGSDETMTDVEEKKAVKDTAQQEQKRKLIASYNAKLKDIDNIEALKALFMDYQAKAKPLGETTVKAIIDGKDKKKAELDALHVQQMDAVNENNEG